MATFTNLGVDEPSTIDQEVACVSVTRNSSAELQEIMCLGDAETTNGIARVMGTTPASTEFGLVVRMPSTQAVLVSSLSGRALVDQNSTVWPVQIPSSQGVVVRQSTASELNVTVAGYSTTVNVSSLAGVVSVDDNGGSLTTDNNNTISSNNSTTATLAGDATFTGTGDDVSAYASVSVLIDASHDSAVDGMTFQFSTDDTNWDDVYAFTYTAANGARRFQFPVTARYFRVVYTNGSTIQTHFRVQTILHVQAITTSVHRLEDGVNPDRSVLLTKTAILAQAAGSGNFIPVQASGGGNFKIDVEELAGTAVSLNNGVADGGTLRVTQANDVPVNVAQNSTVWAVQVPSSQGVVVRQSTAAELNVTVAGYSTTVNVSSGVMDLAAVGGTAVAVNSGVPDAGTQRVMQPVQDGTATLGALNDAITFTNTDGVHTCSGQILSGTFEGTIVAEGSPDGTNWFDLIIIRHDTLEQVSGGIVLTNPNPNLGFTVVAAANNEQLRLRVSAYTSGSMSGFLKAAQVMDPFVLSLDMGANGSNVPVFARQIGVSDGTNVNSVVGGSGTVTAGTMRVTHATDVNVNTVPVTSSGLALTTNAQPQSTAYGVVTRSALPAMLSTTASITSTASSAFYEVIAGAGGVTQRCYAYAVTSTVQTPGAFEFLSGTNAPKWGVSIGGQSSGVTGANLAIAPPAYLFATDTAAALNVRAATTGVYQVSVSYFAD